MEVAARHLREARAAPAPAPTCLVLQQPDSVGGAALLWQLAAAVAADGASRVLALTLVDPEPYVRGWLPQERQGAVSVVPLRAGSSLRKQALAALPAGPGVHVFVDSLSLALMCWPASEVAAALLELAEHAVVAGMASLLCTGLHSQRELDLARSLATCEVLLRPPKQLQADVMASSIGCTAHVEAVTSTLRHSGARAFAALHSMQRIC